MADSLNKNYTQPRVGLWNRLEARPTKHDFSNVLSAKTFDALWMLNRQWQFGEFKGEDTGSAVFSQIELKNTKFSRFAPGNKDIAAIDVEAYNEQIPLEAKVEAERIDFDLKTQLEISVYWKRLLQQKFSSNTVLLNSLLAAFKTAYTLTPPSFSTIEEAANYNIHKRAKIIQKTSSRRWLLDAEQLCLGFKNQLQANQSIISLLGPVSSISPTESNLLNQTAQAFVDWFDMLWIQPNGKATWAENRLEYQFANTVPNDSPTQAQHTLVANEYYQGKLDWYAYDLDTTASPLNSNSTLPDNHNQSVTFTRTMFPSPARFQGMPTPRWWEFEDGTINFGKISSNTNDISHILLAQFGLIYSNDWQVIPFKIPVGSLSEIKKLLVTDVFGQKTIVQSANKNIPQTNGVVDSNWDYWAMFNLSHNQDPNTTVPDGKLLFPPTINKVMQSKAVEEVVFARDEVTNLVWAIEKTIMGPLAKGVDWDNLSREKKRLIIEEIGLSLPPSTPLEVSNYVYQYLTNTTPENWIPFVARKQMVGQNPSNTSVVLQRGKMQRHFPGVTNVIKDIRPTGRILASDNSPYFLQNEEIPKTGVLVSRNFQRTRWLNGKVINWLGRRKTAAFGQIHSQLEFDKTEHAKKLDLSADS